MQRRSQTALSSERKRELKALYETHPINERAIISRLLRQGRSLTRITETELAEDPEGGITDQNHIGGIAFTKQLAKTARIGRDAYVLDLGCGLGGSARCLALLFGCHVYGIDVSVRRCREARRLTRLVGLDHLVTIRCGDVLTTPLPARKFDVLWGQSAWVHIDDRDHFIKKWSRSLKPDGRIAFEEAYLRRRPKGSMERRALAVLSDYWKACLASEESWIEILRANGFEIHVTEDLSPQLSADYCRMSHLAQTKVISGVPESEQRAWKLAIALVAKGIVGYIRVVGNKSRVSK